MRFTKICVAVAAFAALGLSAGCGKSDSESSRFNDVLGGTVAGAPITRATPDVAILSDQSAYKPTATPGGGGGESSGGESPAAGGGDAEPVKQVAKTAIEAIFTMNLDGIFDVMVPEQIAAINNDDVRSAIQDTFNALQNFQGELAEKSGQDAPKAAESRLATAESRSATVLEEGQFDILSESAATITLPPATLLKLMGTADALATPEGAEAAKAAGAPDLEALAQMIPPVVINVVKSGDAWKLDLKRPLTESDANDLRSAFDELKAGATKMSETLAGLKATTPAEIGMAMAPAGMQFGMALARVGMILQGTGAAAAPTSAPTEQPKAEETPAEGESAPAPVGTGRRGRGPRQP
ncbi:MAG: hypothetical protein ACKVS9_19790 [Phycisphaerae bacterium]